MHIRDIQKDAIERAVPKEFEAKNKLSLDTKILPAIKDWKTGESYKITEMEITQISSDEMTDGTIKAEFEVTKVTEK